MSLFNLDRFRFHKEKALESVSCFAKGEQRQLGDKENYLGGQLKPNGRRGRGKVEHHALDVPSDDETIKKPKESPAVKATEHEQQRNLDIEDKVIKLQEMFPKRSRSELLEVINNTSTLDGAVAYCLVIYRDKDTDSSKTNWKAAHSDCESQPKKRRKTLKSDSDQEYEETVYEPSIKKQEALIRKLKQKLPEMENVVLRELLKAHKWDLENTLGSVFMFSTEPDSTFAQSQKKNIAKSTQESNGDAKQKSNSTSLSCWLSANKSPSGTWNLSNRKSVESKTVNQKFKKVKAAILKPDQNSDSDAEELDSEVEDVSNDSDCEDDGYSTGDKDQILRFLQEASLDELTLISGCSLKKAQKIISLRPFNSWKDVNDQFYKDNGLSLDLVDGCKMVLKQRQVLKQLMNRCEDIAKKMTRDITQVIERGLGSMKQPTVLNKKFKLQPYQLIGLKWLILLHQHNLSGILADEMGLGKTIQAISFLAHLYQNGNKGPHLITVPSSTLDNWVRELQTWCPSLKVVVYYGSVEDRKHLRHEILNNLVEFNVIVSTYNLTIGNEYDRNLFRKLKLQYALFDEGHMLKNMNTLRYRYLMAINAEQRLLLTGTPLQNNLLELISLLNFIMPSMFSSSTSKISKLFSTFRIKFLKIPPELDPESLQQLHHLTPFTGFNRGLGRLSYLSLKSFETFKSSEEESGFHKERIAQAKLIMKPFILRRVKTEVLKELPPKVEKLELCAMSKAQQQLYDKLFSRLKKTVSGEKRELSNVMMQLRKMANHPLLHRQYYTSERLRAMSKAMLKEPTHFDADPALIQADMEVMSDFELHKLCKEYRSINSFQLQKDLILDSGKFCLLTKQLVKLKEKGDRVVLFSQFTMMLDIIETLLNDLGHLYVRLDGSTPMAERIGLIDKYNTDPQIFIFLLSTRAGGQGINLASANVVILHDIDCNPFNDKQAEDRCHRMGQTRAVKVIKLISKNSIEDCMLRVGQEKLKLEQDMTTDDEEGAMSEAVADLLKVSLGL